MARTRGYCSDDYQSSFLSDGCSSPLDFTAFVGWPLPQITWMCQDRVGCQRHESRIKLGSLLCAKRACLAPGFMFFRPSTQGTFGPGCSMSRSALQSVTWLSVLMPDAWLRGCAPLCPSLRARCSWPRSQCSTKWPPQVHRRGRQLPDGFAAQRRHRSYLYWSPCLRHRAHSL